MSVYSDKRLVKQSERQSFSQTNNQSINRQIWTVTISQSETFNQGCNEVYGVRDQCPGIWDHKSWDQDQQMFYMFKGLGIGLFHYFSGLKGKHP